MVFTIYCITNIHNNKRYIGQTRQAPRVRWTQHVSDAKTGRRVYFQQAIRKYGPSAFEHYVLEELPSVELANEAEQRWIRYFRSNVREFGYNLEMGGGLKIPSAETRERQSIAQKRRFARPGAREQLSKQVKDAHPGVSDTAKLRLSEIHRGHTRNRGRNRGPHSDEHRTKIANAKTGRPVTHKMGVTQLTLEGTLLHTFPSLTAAAKSVGTCAQTIKNAAIKGWDLAGFRWQLYP